MSNISKISKKILKDRYIENSPRLSKEELAEVLVWIIKETNKNGWRLVQHKNVESDYTWYELDLQDDWDENICDEIEWLNYIR